MFAYLFIYCETLYKSPHCAKNGRKKNQKIRKVKSKGEIMFPQPPHNQNLGPLVSFLQVLCPGHRFSLRQTQVSSFSLKWVLNIEH